MFHIFVTVLTIRVIYYLCKEIYAVEVVLVMEGGANNKTAHLKLLLAKHSSWYWQQQLVKAADDIHILYNIRFTSQVAYCPIGIGLPHIRICSSQPVTAVTVTTFHLSKKHQELLLTVFLAHFVKLMPAIFQAQTQLKIVIKF